VQTLHIKAVQTIPEAFVCGPKEWITGGERLKPCAGFDFGTFVGILRHWLDNGSMFSLQ
jgi:hypothetical protein